MQTPLAEYHFGSQVEKEKGLDAVPATSIPGAVGLTGRRFPFRAESAEDRKELQGAIAAIVAWASGVICRLCLGVRLRGWCEATRDDVLQDVLIDLLEHSLPKFDAHDPRQAKLETFLFKCIVNALRTRLKTLSRDRFYEGESLSVVVDRPAPPINPIEDEAIVELAVAITSRPEQFLNERDAAFLKIWLERNGATQRELAEQLGLRCRQDVSNRLERVIQRTLAAVSTQLAALHR